MGVGAPSRHLFLETHGLDGLPVAVAALVPYRGVTLAEMPTRGTGSPQVTVVVPTRDRPIWLADAVASVLGQDEVEVRVIVVDDGSDPSLSARVAGLAEPRVQVRSTAGSIGVSAARNLGLESVDTPWVAFLDDDDLWARRHLADMLGVARERAADVVYVGWLNADAGGRVASVEPPFPEDAIVQALHERNALGPPACVLMRTDDIRRVGGFDPALSVLADWDLWLRLAREGARIVHCPKLSVAYTRHEGNMHRDVDRTLAEVRRLAERHGESAVEHGAVLPGPGFPFWIARCYADGGARGRAAGWFLRSFLRRRRSRDLAHAVDALVGGRVKLLSRRLRGSPVPPPPELIGWVRDARRHQSPPSPDESGIGDRVPAR